jgi:hypothetical protein
LLPFLSDNGDRSAFLLLPFLSPFLSTFLSTFLPFFLMEFSALLSFAAGIVFAPSFPRRFFHSRFSSRLQGRGKAFTNRTLSFTNRTQIFCVSLPEREEFALDSPALC